MRDGELGRKYLWLHRVATNVHLNGENRRERAKFGDLLFDENLPKPLFDDEFQRGCL